MGHNSKHTINKTMKEFHLFNQNPERRRPTIPLTPEVLGPLMIESLQRYLPDNHLGRCNCMGKVDQNAPWLIRWTQDLSLASA